MERHAPITRTAIHVRTVCGNQPLDEDQIARVGHGGVQSGVPAPVQVLNVCPGWS